jgi:hypothetical protein
MKEMREIYQKQYKTFSWKSESSAGQRTNTPSNLAKKTAVTMSATAA